MAMIFQKPVIKNALFLLVTRMKLEQACDQKSQILKVCAQNVFVGSARLERSQCLSMLVQINNVQLVLMFNFYAKSRSPKFSWLTCGAVLKSI